MECANHPLGDRVHAWVVIPELWKVAFDPKVNSNAIRVADGEDLWNGACHAGQPVRGASRLLGAFVDAIAETATKVAIARNKWQRERNLISK